MPKHIKNILEQDFRFTYANEDKPGSTEYLLKAGSITTLPTWLADKILKQMANEAYNRGWGREGYPPITEVERIKNELLTVKL